VVDAALAALLVQMPIQPYWAVAVAELVITLSVIRSLLTPQQELVKVA
jgi:hypothetical protein